VSTFQDRVSSLNPGDLLKEKKKTKNRNDKSLGPMTLDLNVPTLDQFDLSGVSFPSYDLAMLLGLLFS
jgi:hypothetical protein